MKYRTREWWIWASERPRVLINLAGLTILIIGTAGVFAWLMTKPIDVLQDWTMHTTETTYHPGDTLEFISTSKKLISADGTSTRIFDCDAADGQPAREIQLDTIVANKAPGYQPPRENSIVVPDVAKFNGLPRTCRLIINTCYNDVILWRDQCESAKTNDFKVIKEVFDADAIRQQIQDLQKQIEDLKVQLVAAESKTRTVVPAPSQPTTSSPTPTKPSPKRAAHPAPVPTNPLQPQPDFGDQLLGTVDNAIIQPMIWLLSVVL